MNDIVDAMLQVLPPSRRTNARGWMTFDCPACSDRRRRGGFRETETGGWRYRCFNGGCEYERSTGWEPGNAFIGRPRRLFEFLGGDIADIPKQFLDQRSSPSALPDAPEIVTEFPEIQLPQGSTLLWRVTSPDALDCQRYVLDRGWFHREHPFVWCPKHPRHVIYPCQHKGKIVAWIGRKIDPGKEFAHIKCQGFPSDYMLNQDQIWRYRTVLVTEGVFDALAVQGLCTFGNTLTPKQINLLNAACRKGRRVALLSDYQKDEWKAYWQTAKENGWYLSCAEWVRYEGEPPIKDASDSVPLNGQLLTIKCAMDGITNDYQYAQRFLAERSRDMWSVG
jgi:hypothetical protein